MQKYELLEQKGGQLEERQEKLISGAVGPRREPSASQIEYVDRGTPAAQISGASSSTTTCTHHALQEFDSEHYHSYQLVALPTARFGD